MLFDISINAWGFLCRGDYSAVAADLARSTISYGWGAAGTPSVEGTANGETVAV